MECVYLKLVLNDSFYIEVYESDSPQKCPNFELCNTTAPKYHFLCHEGYCRTCHMSFGKNFRN